MSARLLTILLLFGAVAAAAILFLRRDRAPSAPPPPLPLPSFLDAGLVEHFDAMPRAPLWGGEAADISRLQIVSDPVRLGPGAIRFTVQPGDIAAKRNRAEIKLFDCGPVGREMWYAWSFLVPADYADTPDHTLFQIMGQFHDMPDRARGETWENFPAHPPMVAVCYGVRDGRPCIALQYGLEGAVRQMSLTPIGKGRWIDLLFRIHWSRGPDGYVEAWRDGRPFTPLSGTDGRVFGPNMYNDAPAMLKIGLYREAGFTTTNSVYFDEVRVGPTREAVER
ncbi:MAG: heparin lyase I family protein [Planctomycetes bacterium]|nr:heparin lyase I family protein [Planctomycetota bacterium]